MKLLLINLLGEIKMTPELILALIALIGTVIGSIVQYVNNKSIGKKAETEANVALVDIALKLNRSELDLVRQENKELREEKVKDMVRKSELELQLKDALFKLKDTIEDRDIQKLSLESVQCELDVQKEIVKELKEIK